jgi:hypothetical protein
MWRRLKYVAHPILAHVASRFDSSTPFTLVPPPKFSTILNPEICTINDQTYEKDDENRLSKIRRKM